MELRTLRNIVTARYKLYKKEQKRTSRYKWPSNSRFKVGMVVSQKMEAVIDCFQSRKQHYTRQML